MAYRTAETSNQSKHALIVRECFANKLLGPAATAIVNKLLDQDRAKPLPFEIGPHDDREFCGDVVRIRYRAHHSERFEATKFALTEDMLPLMGPTPSVLPVIAHLPR